MIGFTQLAEDTHDYVSGGGRHLSHEDGDGCAE